MTRPPQVRSLLELLFGFSAPVNRKSYICCGAVLMLIKYLVEFFVASVMLDKPYSPLVFLTPLASVRESYLQDASTPFLIFLVLWSLPFLWVGVSMSARRAADAGHSPSKGLLFLFPGLNYFVMGIYSLLPSKDVRPATFKPGSPVQLGEAEESRVKAVLIAVGSSALLCVPVVFLSSAVQVLYSTLLFVGLPTVVGAIASWIWNRDAERSDGSSRAVAISAVTFGGAFIMLFALEGLLCLAMAFPFAAVGALLGAPLGRYFAAHGRNRRGMVANCCVLVTALVAFAPLEAVLSGPYPLRAVATERRIEAPPSDVWNHVVQFSEIPAPTELIFRAGIAYPIRARIEGSGLGAVRHCEFSTGAFVEPITDWDPPRTLRFSVTAQPPTMSELSFYRDIEPPHLTETFASHKGGFELVPLDGGRATLLKGTTWYTLEMEPQMYWTLWTDFFIHQIHGRVLEHIKREAEIGVKRRA